MRLALKYIFICIALLYTAVLHAQSRYSIMENSASWFVDKELAKMNVYYHGSIKPALLPDSLRIKAHNAQTGLADKLFPGETFGKGNITYTLLPLGGFNYEKYGDTSLSDVSGGFMADISYKNKLTLSGDFTASKGTYSPYWIQRADTLNVMPGYGLRYNNSAGKLYYENWNINLSYSPNKFINLQAGKGKNFWGYGYRSLFLSDNASNYPFLKFTADFWHIRYISMVAQMKDIRNAGGDPSKYVNKYGTFHLLSWNVTKRFNISVFESVIWQAKDTLQNRQLDINYLNPVIFFRPVEFSLGSSDNSLIGFGMSYKVNDNINIYFQGLLDEFVLDQIKADSGWWANKYGLQIGFKAIEPFKVKGLYVQTEYNAVRPFTYSHGSIAQNYAHFNQPLAHPTGSNFRDWVTIIKYNYKWVTFINQTVIANYGSDTSNLNFGGNMFQSYRNRAQDYHNYIGQGLNNMLFYNKTGVEVLLVKQNNLRFELGYIIRNLKNDYGKTQTNYLYIGLRAALYNTYKDY